MAETHHRRPVSTLEQAVVPEETRQGDGIGYLFGIVLTAQVFTALVTALADPDWTRQAIEEHVELQRLAWQPRKSVDGLIAEIRADPKFWPKRYPISLPLAPVDEVR